MLIVQAMAFTKYLGHMKVKIILEFHHNQHVSKVRFTDDGQVESWQGLPILLDNSFEKASL